VGLTHLLKGNVILIAGADEVGQDALAYVASIRGKFPLAICFLKTDDLRAISESPACIVDRLLSQAPHSCCRKDALLI
jgi:hypothetical protein